MRILIVDDDAVIVAIVRVILGASGFTVHDADCGDTGVSMALSSDYDAILLDLSLGDRSGISVLQELRERGVQVPILVLTAEVRPDVIQTALDAGADEYVVKPLRIEKLPEQIRSAVRRSIAGNCGKPAGGGI